MWNNKEEIEKANQIYVKTQKAREFFHELGIKYRDNALNIIDEADLYDLLNDNKKLAELVSKIKMKNFW
jgi:alcohol dehydrogenase YqhD (iron-dependent ADH family)